MSIKILNAFLILLVAIVVALIARWTIDYNHTCKVLDFNATKQEALICGARQDSFQYVEHYTIEKNYVIDYDTGRLFNVWLCSPFDKQEEK